MTARLPAGPYRTIQLEDGTEVTYYIIPFDKRGICEGPETRRDLIDSAARANYSDIFLFSHGWNNDWTTATRLYEHFMSGYMRMWREHGLAVPASYKPLLAGIFWPSTALVFTEEEKGPSIAAGDPEAIDEAIAEERFEISELAADLPDEQARRFYELVQKDSLSDPGEVLELARIAMAFYQSKDDELHLDTPLTPEDLVEIWSATTPEPEDLNSFGTLPSSTAGGPRAAAGLGDIIKKLNPRNLVRAFTVYQMKDRAGTVGSYGVNPLLRDLLGKSNARVHLIGHSFGGKVVLSATCYGGDLPRNVESMLLLQPAVSHLCFADKIPKTNQPGGYRSALRRVSKPILTTYSEHDAPLTKTYHLALRRKEDLGDARIAAPRSPPNKYAALGGFGPRNSGEDLIDIHDVNQPYTFDPKKRIYGLNGSRTISGHGDISNQSTWWALYSLMST